MRKSVCFHTSDQGGGYQTEGSVERGCPDKTGYCQRRETDVDETATNSASDCYQLVKCKEIGWGWWWGEGRGICALCYRWVLAPLGAYQPGPPSGLQIKTCRSTLPLLCGKVVESSWLFRLSTAGQVLPGRATFSPVSCATERAYIGCQMLISLS